MLKSVKKVMKTMQFEVTKSKVMTKSKKTETQLKWQETVNRLCTYDQISKTVVASWLNLSKQSMAVRADRKDATLIADLLILDMYEQEVITYYDKLKSLERAANLFRRLKS